MLRIVINSLVSVTVLGLCVFGYTFLGQRERPDRNKPRKSPLTIVTTEPMRIHSGPVPIAANGLVVPLREIRLATEVTGRVIQQSENLRAGRIVDAGEVLIRLDPQEYEIEVRRLKAQAKQESSEIAAADVGIENAQQLSQLAKLQVQIAKVEAARVNQLIERQAASASELDAVRRSEITAQSALVEVQNRRRDLVAARQLIVDKQALTAVQLERAELDLERCIVESPIKGIVVSSSVEERSFISAGTTFVTIEDSSAVEIRVNLTSDQMVWIWGSNVENPATGSVAESSTGVLSTGEASLAPGRVTPVPAIVTRKFGTDEFQWTARLQRIDGAGIDPATRTYPCLFRVDQPASTIVDAGTRRLTRSMFVDVKIMATPNRMLHRVSESAIRPGNRLWLNVDGKLRIAQATVLSRIGDSLIVELPKQLNPMPDNALVITSPISNPTEGMAVGTESEARAEMSINERTVDDSPSPRNVARVGS